MSAVEKMSNFKQGTNTSAEASALAAGAGNDNTVGLVQQPQQKQGMDDIEGGVGLDFLVGGITGFSVGALSAKEGVEAVANFRSENAQNIKAQEIAPYKKSYATAFSADQINLGNVDLRTVNGSNVLANAGKDRNQLKF